MTINEIAACMLEGVPYGTSSIDVMLACGAIAGEIILAKAPPHMRRAVTEKFVSDIYDYVQSDD